jgi:cytochrome c1
MKTIKLLILALSLTAASFNALSAGAKIDLDHANTDIMDRASLQNGAKLFMNYCSAEPSTGYYTCIDSGNRISSSIPFAELKEELSFLNKNSRSFEYSNSERRNEILRAQ